MGFGERALAQQRVGDRDRIVSASVRSSAPAPEITAPWPTRSTGRRAAWSIVAAQATWTGSLTGDLVTGKVELLVLAGSMLVLEQFWGMSMRTGPGRPDLAM